jgi:hypothetical protein
MGKQSEHMSRGDRNVVGWLLFAVATSMALLFLNVGSAYAQDTAATSSDASNDSGGAATTGTGDADATGNAAATDSGQGASVAGHNGSIHVVRQSNTVNNNGVAVANTGGNTANGNTTDDQTAVNGQLAAGGGVASNSGRAANSSDGSAAITTGDATATGNASTTNVHQEANVNAVGGLGSIVIVTQDADVNNFGVGIANTGGNNAQGNNVDDQTALNAQGALAVGSIANNNGAASNKAQGSAGIDTGDANAVGNASQTNVTQIANVNAGGSLGGIVLIRQRADVDNVGVAVANTGLNTANGNLVDDQTAATAQLAGAASINGPPDLAVASNDGTASNYSGGEARIRTGDASAVGNHSKTHITQSANTYVTGGGFVVTDQDADVDNLGVGIANSGLNQAVGNVTDDQIAVTPQLAVALELGGGGDDTAIAGNFGSASNATHGTAEIGTGNATGIGNKSETNISQSANSAIDGGNGFIVPIQTADVDNIGVGIANTGGNAAVGNITDDQIAIVPQLALGVALGAGDDIAVGGNFGQASNSAHGYAAIGTGNATATGNDAVTGIAQSSASYIGPAAVGFIVPIQTADVDNIGVGIANTGLNVALGNINDDQIAIVPQAALGLATGGGDDISTAGNFGQATNVAAGTALIGTGTADATGNKSATAVSQASANYIGAGGVGGNDPFIVPIQTVDVDNIGVGVANSGLNAAVGNITDNQIAVVPQLAASAALGGGDDTAIAGNFGSAVNKTSGTAAIATGDACAAGNNSVTYITQYAGSGIDGVGFIVPIQTADVNNIGVGIANSGLNAAVGNITDDQVALTLQAALALTLGGGDDLATASNDGVASNWTDGAAHISTGAANAEGNRSATGITQTSNAFLSGVGFVVPVQTAVVNNIGVALANSGGNAAVGNITDDQLAITGQAALALEIGGGDDVALANNSAASTNSTNGTATINTGDACAAGNVAANVVNQNSNVFAPAASFVVTLQDAVINNLGVGIANSGLNQAVGNITDDQIAVSPQLALALSIGGGDDLAIANNAARNSNETNGHAGISTGSATATGNWATNGVSQEANVFALGPFNVTLQDAPINNFGVGIANTGLNAGQGNLTDDQLAVSPQLALGLALGGGDDLGIGNNIADTSNATNGTSGIATGNATATGNQASNLVCQATNGVCPDLAFPPLPEPLCPCKHKEEEEVPVPTPEAPKVPGVPGEQLPVTGSPLAAQALLGLVLVALGAGLRRKRQLA